LHAGRFDALLGACASSASTYLKPAEARRALREMRSELTQEHVAEVEAKVLQAERDAATAEGQVADPVTD
jgi:hypothetical protein